MGRLRPRQIPSVGKAVLLAAAAVPVAVAGEAVQVALRLCREPLLAPPLVSSAAGRAITLALTSGPGTAHRFAPLGQALCSTPAIPVTGPATMSPSNMGDGMTTMSSHMSSVAIRAGQTVRAGQIIGYVGATGRAFGAHLHFELYPAGVKYGDVYSAINPQPWLSASGVTTH